MKKKTKLISYTAILTALYVVLSVLLKIPVTEHITLDLGYIALTVCAVFLGAVPAGISGAVGALIESAIMSARGISPGWILMNLIVGLICGAVLYRAKNKERKKFILSACVVIPLAMLLGVTVKTFVDVLLYTLPLAPKVMTGLAAWSTDTIVMLLIGIPLCLALKKKVKNVF